HRLFARKKASPNVGLETLRTTAKRNPTGATIHRSKHRKGIDDETGAKQAQTIGKNGEIGAAPYGKNGPFFLRHRQNERTRSVKNGKLFVPIRRDGRTVIRECDVYDQSR